MAAAPFHLTDTDRATLAMTDEEFVHDTWIDLKNAIGTALIIAAYFLGRLISTSM